MKRQIRRGVFESNSSSQHSLVVMKNGDHYTSDEILRDIWLHDGVWNIYESRLEFGRSPYRALWTFSEKWRYACASLVKEYNDEVYKSLEALAFKYVPGLKKIKLPTETRWVSNVENCDDKYSRSHGMTETELIEFLSQKEKDWNIPEIEYWEDAAGDFRYEAPYTGYTDEDFLSGFLKQENLSLEEFLTNKKYVIIQDGDEYDYFGEMKAAGLINTDAIDHEVPDYEEND